MSFYYGSFRAVKDVNLNIERQKITAIIGPSGCGKSTVLRSFNRMNDFIPGTRVEGEILFHKQNIYDPRIDPVQIRKTIGMVFQKPNPFPKTIYENVAWGARINGYRGNMDELVEQTLRQAALWDEVKDKLQEERPGPFRRAAAAPVHCPRPGGGTGDDPDGRTLLRPGPDRHLENRRSDARTVAELTPLSSSPTTCSRPPAPRT